MHCPRKARKISAVGLVACDVIPNIHSRPATPWTGPRRYPDVGRNKPARRQQGRVFPAIRMPETPVFAFAQTGLFRPTSEP